MTREELIAKVEGLEKAPVSIERDNINHAVHMIVSGKLPNTYDNWPNFVGSVDAVLALIQEKLPGWRVYGVWQRPDRAWWIASIEMIDDPEKKGLRGYAAKPALALLAATLRALPDNGKEDDPT